MATMNVHMQGVDLIGTADAITNAMFTDVLGNKEDAANVTADQASVIGLLRYIIANYDSDADVAALLGAITTAAHTGAVDNATTIMGYVKQLITDLRVTKGDLDNGGRLDLLIDAILADTAELQTDWVNGGRLDLLIDAIKAVTDVLPDAGALTSIAQETTVAAIQTDLGNPSARTNLQTIEAMLGNPDTASHSIWNNLGAFYTRTNNKSLLAVLGVPDVAGKDFYTCLITDRLDHATFGLSALNTDLDAIKVMTDKVGTITNTAGTASIGAILGDFANVDLVTRLTTIDDFLDTEVSAIKTETDQIGTIVNAGGTATIGAILGDFANVTLVARLNTIDDFLDTEVAAIATSTATTIPALHTVPVADVATNTNMRDVIGNKTDAAATGAVSAVESLMAYSKQLVTELQVTDALVDTLILSTTFPTEDLATDATIAQVVGKKSDTVAGTSLVALSKQVLATTAFPTEDLATDSTFAQVVGKKSDTVAGTSLVSIGKQILAAVTTVDDFIDTEIATITSKLTADAFQTATVATPDASITPWTVAAHRLFTVTGVVEIQRIFGVVSETVVEGAGADNTVSIGTSDDVDVMIGATVGDALVANDIWAAVAGGSLAKHVLLTNAESFLVSSTDIDINVLGTNSITDGTITFYCTWKPISVGATVVAAVWD